MEELIEFTLLLKQVDDDELIQFLTTSMKGYGHTLFRKLYFNYFMNHRTNIKEHTQCLSDIINARKDKPNLCTDFTSYDRIDKLPSTLIAECASYLPLNEYFRFSRSNRQIFVSVNKPFKLYELTGAALRKCPQTMNMRKFKAVKSIHIDIERFNQHISIPNQSIWKDSSFDKVTLSNNFSDDETRTAAFFAKKAINLNKITELRLCHFGDDDDSLFYSCKAFCKILSCLKNVKRLWLQHIYLDRVEVKQSELFNKDLVQKWFPNLTSFGIDVSSTTVIELGRAIIDSIGHQIESLQISGSAGASALETVTCNFSKLKELELSYPSQACLNAFSKVTALQSMSVTSDEENILKSCIDFMLKKQKSIHRMRIYAISFENLKCVFDRIQSVLFDSYSEGVKRD
eukprot:362008_1